VGDSDDVDGFCLGFDADEDSVGGADSAGIQAGEFSFQWFGDSAGIFAERAVDETQCRVGDFSGKAG
jgi:hypothetical protein